MVPPSIVKRGIIAVVFALATPLVRGFYSLPFLPAAVVWSPQSGRRMSSDGADPSRSFEVRYEMLLKEKDLRIDFAEKTMDKMMAEKDKTMDKMMAEKDKTMDKMMAEKDKTMDKMMAEKDKRIEELQEFMKAITAGKDEMIAKERDDKVKAEALAASTRARFVAEINLRPVIEQHIKAWWRRMGKTKGFVGVQAMIDLFVDEDVTFNANLTKAMAEIAYFDDTAIKRMMSRIYDEMSYPLHNVRKVPEAPPGFVVNKNKPFSVCLSALLRCFGEPHKVMDEEYEVVICEWRPEAESLDRSGGNS
jgi:hypothetical protein